jgi:hypothetical protein
VESGEKAKQVKFETIFDFCQLKGGRTVKRVVTILCLAVVCLLLTNVAYSQASQVYGGLTIIVTDPDGKAVAGATVTVTDMGTGVSTVPDKTASDGRLSIANLQAGKYIVTVTAPNFKTAKIENAEVVTSRVYDLTVKLEIGAVTMETTVQAGGQEVLETVQSSVQTTISGKSITQLPLTSHQGTLLAVLDPGAQVQGGARNARFEGLPIDGVNITFDGINVQDNYNKSSCGLFAMLDARLDDVEEFGIQTNANSPDKSAEGAVQISYVSKRGQNDFHGGVWEYNRNTDFNANYFMNNLFNTPRTAIDLNEFGGKAGGHILKDKLFFFGDIDYFQLPVKGFTGSATIYNNGPTASANGYYTYVPTSAQVANPNLWTTCTSGSSQTCTINTMSGPNSLAAQTGNPTTVDPFLASLYSVLQTTPSSPKITGVVSCGLNYTTYSFGQPAAAHSVVPDGRIDYIPNKKSSFEFDYHYLFNDRNPDFLNGDLYLFPVAPFSSNQGATIQNRSLFIGAWTYAISPNMSNQIRIGVQSAPVNFGDGLSYNTTLGYIPVTTSYGPTTPELSLLNLPGNYTNPNFSFGSVQGRNAALGQMHEVLTWSHGAHSFSFGYDQTDLHSQLWLGEGGTINTGIVSSDPLSSGMFAAGNLPGIGTSDLSGIEGLYAGFIGRVDSFGDSSAAIFRPDAAVNGGKPGFVNGVSFVQRVNQNEFGFWGSDSWRVRNGLTLNLGLRWEYQGVINDPWAEFFAMQNGVNDLWGQSGVGNLFHPGSTAGTPFAITGTDAAPVYADGQFFVNDKNYQWYHKWYRGLAPSIGFAYTPNFDNHIAKMILGGPNKSVFRAGYAISYGREGAGVLEDLTTIGGNTASQSASAAAATNQPNGLFQAGSVTVNQLVTGTTMPGVLENPTAFVTGEQVPTQLGFPEFAFAPNLHPSMVQSWSVGLQREITPNMALEIRYVGNHGTGLQREININETNIFENGFLNEFNNALSNMNICNANHAACVAAEKDAGILTQGSTTTVPVSDFADIWGAATTACAAGVPPASCAGGPSVIAALSGQVVLPILTGAISPNTGNAATFIGPGFQNDATAEVNPLNQASANFHNGTFITDLNQGLAGSFASSLAGSTTFFPQLVLAGFPGNFWRVNPGAEFGGSDVLCNCSSSTYNAGVVDFRRRPSHGVQFDVSYTYEKSLTNNYSGNGGAGGSFTTLRDLGFDKGPAPYDLRNMIKSQFIYDLPFGQGKRWSSSSKLVNYLIGGWQVGGITRWQTGPPVEITSGNGGTFNANDPGVNLIGLTTGQLQNMLSINETEGGTGSAASKWVYYVPASLLDANLQKANTSIIQPCNVAGTLCSRIYMYGPSFFKADWNIVKTTKITERMNVEIRMEALNVFNDPDFGWCAFSQSTASGCAVSTQSKNFGKTGLGTRLGAAYYDFNTTWDPGGRNLQLVGRFNW